MAEASNGGPERKRFRRRVAAGYVAAGIAGTALAVALAWGDDGYGSNFEACDEGVGTGVEATPGSGDEDDPAVILRFARDAGVSGDEYYDGQADPNAWNAFFGYDDDLDKLGEIACGRVSGENDTVSPNRLVFTPDGLNARQGYIAQESLNNTSPESL